jgi:hypothetical protein
LAVTLSLLSLALQLVSAGMAGAGDAAPPPFPAAALCYVAVQLLRCAKNGGRSRSNFTKTQHSSHNRKRLTMIHKTLIKKKK